MIKQFLTTGKFTLFSVSNMLASTLMQEITVTTVIDPAPRGYDDWRFGTFKPRNKRKQYYLDQDPTWFLAFAGWDLPVKSDFEWFKAHSKDGVSGFLGNAKLNLCGEDFDFVADFVRRHNLNPHCNLERVTISTGYYGEDDKNYIAFPSSTDFGLPAAEGSTIQGRILNPIDA